MGSSYRPSLLHSRLMRPGSHRRTGSNSSEASHASSSSTSEDQFVFSAGNTPSTENPPSGLVVSGHGGSIASTHRDGLLLGKEANGRSQLANDTSRSLDSSQQTTSKPIAIVPPTVRKLSIAPAPTPPEPLSARGDLPGGYFPFHEDPASRIRPTHPFQLDASKARHSSLHQASESESTMSVSVDSRQATNMPKSPLYSIAGSPKSVTSDSHTPVSSYIPIGVHDTAALPMGKYYPSNYENRPGSSAQTRQRPITKSHVVTSIKSEPQVPKFRREASHTRTGSDVKRRLLQYQRDMIAQATIAASALLEKNGSNAHHSSNSTAGSSLGGLSLKNIELGGTMLKTHKPSSPRLAPLGSPGPVTPMDLEGASGDSYMTLGRLMTGPDAVQQSAELSRAIQVERTRQYHKSAHSPASELHAVSF